MQTERPLRTRTQHEEISLPDLANTLTDLSRAVIDGNLAVRGDVERFDGPAQRIVQSFNNVLDAVVKPLSTATEYLEYIAKGALPRKIIDEYHGDFHALKDNLNDLIDHLRELSNMAHAIANGDLSVQINKRSEKDILAFSFQHIVEVISWLVEEIQTLNTAIVEGKLAKRGNFARFQGDFAHMVHGINTMLDTVIEPLNVATEYLERLAAGKIPAKITDEYQGDFQALKNVINQCIETERAAQEHHADLQQRTEGLQQQTVELEHQRTATRQRNLALEHIQRVVNDKVKELEVSSKYQVELLAFITEALTLSQGEALKREVQISELSLKDLATMIGQHFARTAKEKGLALKVTLAKDLPASICTDRQRVEQIVKNFLSNALTFTERGSVNVRIARPAPEVTLANGLTPHNAIAISVVDTGIGIAEAKQRVIRAMLQSTDMPAEREPSDIGFGLFLSQELAKLLGGEIQFHSEEGKGSTFTLYVSDGIPGQARGLRRQERSTKRAELSRPRPSSSEARTLPPEPQTASPEPQPERLAALEVTQVTSAESLNIAFKQLEEHRDVPIQKLLIVEDDDVIRDSMVELLSDEKHEITTAMSGTEAYQLMQTNVFDCLIIDQRLTNLAGTEGVELIRKDPTLTPLPVLVYTQQTETEQVEPEFSPDQPQKPPVFYEKDPALDGKHVLVVDDDLSEILMLTSVAESEGLHVLIAETGKDALKKLEDNPAINLVLLDTLMPEMDGDEAIRTIRRQRRFKKLPIIALTTASTKDNGQQYLEAGANDYLAKPVEPEKLLSLLRVWLY